MAELLLGDKSTQSRIVGKGLQSPSPERKGELQTRIYPLRAVRPFASQVEVGKKPSQLLNSPVSAQIVVGLDGA